MNEQAEAEQATAAADQPTQSHTERVKKPPLHTYDAGHGVKVKGWGKTGSRGDYTEMSVERSFKVGEDWKTQSLNIPNSALAELLDKLQQGEVEFIDQHQQAQARER
jgi:hypothetical protein